MYEQIFQILREEILQSKYGRVGCVGTHSELAERFDTSIITIRAAVQKLADEGLVTVKQGKGTFVNNVNKAMLHDNLNRLTGVSNIMLDTNIVPTVLVKDFCEIETPSYFDENYKTALGKRCFYIERVHMIKDTVIGYAKLYLPLEYGRNLSKEEIEIHTIYELYQNKLGIPLGKGIERIRAASADKYLADALNVKKKTPLFFIHRESYSADNILIELMELYFEYTQYEFKVELDLSIS